MADIDQTRERPRLLLAEALRYPGPGRLELLTTAAADLPPGVGKEALVAFTAAVSTLTPEAWEELAARILDLEPRTAPYLGHLLWGDDYRRAQLLARLTVLQREAAIDTDGELPDHLVPVLRLLAARPDAGPEVARELRPALDTWGAQLDALFPGTPYRLLLPALQAAFEPDDVDPRAGRSS